MKDSAFRNLLTFHPQFAVAAVYAVVTGIVETTRARHGMEKSGSIASGCLLIIGVGSILKGAVSFTSRTKHEERGQIEGSKCDETSEESDNNVEETDDRTESE